MKTQLEQLKQFTTIVADTGDFESIQDLKPTDATTNPSLILKAVQQKEYQHLLEEVVQLNKFQTQEEIMDALLIRFGQEILEVVPGRVSTEIDARLSFDTQATIERARKLIKDYEKAGTDPHRILIKIASTWEGIQAAKTLEEEGIRCNMTLLFSLAQAVACAKADVQLISPFVGRIYDWHKSNQGNEWNEDDNKGVNDPGVKSVSQIFHYYKKHGIDTEIMGASFRNKEQILALAGCDLLTISPELLHELNNSTEVVQPILDHSSSHKMEIAPVLLTEASFRFVMNENTMANDKLAEGIRAFVNDARKLDRLIEQARND